MSNHLNFVRPGPQLKHLHQWLYASSFTMIHCFEEFSMSSVALLTPQKVSAQKQIIPDLYFLLTSILLYISLICFYGIADLCSISIILSLDMITGIADGRDALLAVLRDHADNSLQNLQRFVERSSLRFRIEKVSKRNAIDNLTLIIFQTKTENLTEEGRKMINFRLTVWREVWRCKHC